MEKRAEKKPVKQKTVSFKWPIKLINFCIDREKNEGKTQMTNIWTERKKQHYRPYRHWKGNREKLQRK